VVKPQARLGSRRRPKTSQAAAYQAFIFFAVIVSVVALLGMGRVWLSVQAAQASIDSSRLRNEIKAERYQGDLLEVQQSALATPSRIQTIAGSTMGMAPAVSVKYLDLGPSDARTGAVPPPPGVATGSALGGMVERVMGVAAGEAQLLLVGDVGLASTK
jgi:cell division protein FtsL